MAGDTVNLRTASHDEIHMPALRTPACLIAALLAASAARAEPPGMHEGHGAAAAVAVASPTLGRVVFPTSTRVPAAQAAFERGLLWLHLFEYPHAAQSFQAAQRLDPGFALAYWGEAMTYTHALWNQDEPEAARAALARLAPTPQARAARIGDARERAWFDSAEQLFGAGTVAERDARFLAAAAALAARFPDDDEAQLLHALALLGATRGVRDEKNYLEAAAIAQRVLARSPSHPGAAHYWIHGMDEPAHAAGALAPAQVLAKIAPDAGHAQHMTSHIFLALGRWDDVVAANEEATRVTDAEIAAAGLPPFPCGHYIEWLQYGYYQQGRPQAAQRLLDACATQGAAAVAWHEAHPDVPFRAFRTPAATKQRWHSSLVAMRSMAVVATDAGRAANAALRIEAGDLGRGAAWDRHARGYAAAAAGDFAAAQSELDALDAIVAQRAGAHEDATLAAHLGVIRDVLAAAIAYRQGKQDEALALVVAAGERYAALPVDYGPPVPVKPPFELAGEWLLAQGRHDEALAMFDRALAMSPGRAASLLGQARARRGRGEAAASQQAYASLAQLWHAAERDQPALAEVREGATAH
jgi:tetratricopeptide (TPR) repeat protein